MDETEEANEVEVWLEPPFLSPGARQGGPMHLVEAVAQLERPGCSRFSASSEGARVVAFAL